MSWTKYAESLIPGVSTYNGLYFRDGQRVSFGSDDDAAFYWDDALGQLVVVGSLAMSGGLELNDGVPIVFGTDDDAELSWNDALGAVELTQPLLFTQLGGGVAFGPGYDASLELATSATTTPETIVNFNAGPMVVRLGMDRPAGNISIIAGGTIAAGDVVAHDTATSKTVRCEPASATPSIRVPAGVSLTAELLDQGSPLLASIQGLEVQVSTSTVGKPPGTVMYADAATPGKLVSTPVEQPGTEVWQVGTVTLAAAAGSARLRVDIRKVQELTIAAPAHLAAIPVLRVQNVTVPIAIGAGVETNTLADPLYAGQRVTLFSASTAGGSRAVTVPTSLQTAPARTTMTFTPAGDYIELVGIALGAGFAWRISGNDGVVLS
jgi:hypothetical protein